MANVNIGTAYDMNKQLYARVPHIPDETVKERQHRMVAWIDYTSNKYYMLLCRERHDYTVFARLHDSTGDNRKLRPITSSMSFLLSPVESCRRANTV